MEDLIFQDDVKEVARDASSPDIIVLKFADSKIPLFKETRSKEWILYGEDNRYPEYLTFLYNKSAKHNAILTGKANYIFGEGYENGDVIVNRLGESLNDIAKKCILDRAIYNGFRLEIVWNLNRRVSEIYHCDFNSIRTGKDGGYWYKETWDPKNRDEPEFIDEFNPNFPLGTQIYAYDEYRPGLRYYPLPDYIGCNNYVETDIEISKFYLSSIRNGMMPSKMLQFFMGDPGEEKKRTLENSFKKKFAGAENAGKFVMVFNPGGKDKAVEIDDLSGTELDKMFVELNKTCQQEIFSGHLVTSPALFGIKTEGQLGNMTELKTAYEIFINTYAKPKANDFDKEVNYLFSYSMWPGKYELRQTDPIGIQFDVKDVVNALPKVFVFKKMGIPEDQWNLPNIGSENKPDSVGDVNTPLAKPLPPAKPAEPSAMSNDNIKNLSAKQHQQLMRIIRQYGKGQLNEPQARTLLRTGLGLSEDDINSILGIAPVQASMSAEEKEDYILAMFDECGDSRDDFNVWRSKTVGFSSELEAEADEAVFIEEAFKTYDVTATEDKILELIKKDSKITPQVIADAIGQTKAYVEAKITNLVKRGYLETTTDKVGEDEITIRTLPKDLDITAPPPTTKTPAVQISIKYSYEPKPGLQAIIATTRAFCRKMIGLNRFYTRAEIESISERLGYSVWDRKGGWWGDNPECRHRWVSNIVVKKK
jgi:DNA-binding Lrp family transcriptional regulator